MNWNNINAAGAQIGMFNTGSIKDVNSIDINISSLKQAGENKIAEALQEVTQAIIKATDVASESDRKELLDQIEELSAQATKPSSERKIGVVKSTFFALTATASALGGLTTVWNTWGPVIQRFFGI